MLAPSDSDRLSVLENVALYVGIAAAVGWEFPFYVAQNFRYVGVVGVGLLKNGKLQNRFLSSEGT